MKQVLLTIDDAPIAGLTVKLAMLRKRRVSAVLFCTGAELARHPNLAVEAIVSGHLLANHSYSHPYFSRITLAEARDQIESTEALIDAAYSRANVDRPGKLFRFPYLENGDGAPYGETDWGHPHVHALQQLLRELDFVPLSLGIGYEWWKRGGFDRCVNVDATFDTHDWVLVEDQPSEHGYHSLESVLKRIDEDVPEGCRGMNYPDSPEIVMMHAFIPNSAFAAILDKLMTKEIAFVPVESCLS